MRNNNEPLTLVRAMILPSTTSYRVFLLSGGGGRGRRMKTSSFLHRIILLLSFPGFINKGENLLVLSYMETTSLHTVQYRVKVAKILIGFCSSKYLKSIV